MPVCETHAMAGSSISLGDRLLAVGRVGCRSAGARDES